jgi:hypothetical protein
MFRKIAVFMMVWIGWATTLAAGGVDTFHYHYSGNFKAWVSTPDTPGPWPVIIYNYDEYWDWAKEETAVERGYNIKSFMTTFNRWGFACIVPIERYRKLNALKGAIAYVKTQADFDSNNISVIGVSEGSFLSLLAPDENLPVSKIIMITPSAFYKSGRLSMSTLKALKTPLKQPIFFIVGARNRNWKLKESDTLYDQLNRLKFNLTYKEYDEKPAWFWNPEHAFMPDIYHFITGRDISPRTL